MESADFRPELTAEQRRAIESRDISVALSAGAGCGKTFVLTERFLSHLAPGDAEGDALSELVAITFTDRAAREMRDRVRSQCNRRLLAARDEDEAEAWLALVRELDGARISTIHSFCGSVLRSHAVEAGLDPRFGVLDQNQSTTLLAELIDDELRRQLIARREATLDLIVRFGLRRLRAMVGMLLGRRHEIDFEEQRAMAPEALLERLREFQRTTLGPALARQLRDSGPARMLVEIAEREPPSHAKMIGRCRVLSERFRSLEASVDLAVDLREIADEATVGGLGNKKGWDDRETHDAFKRYAGKTREWIQKRLLPALTLDLNDAREAVETGLRLLEVAAPIAEAYQERKRELGVLDFDDLLISARELLVRRHEGRIGRRLASQIRLLLVDEFQDTDPLQVELVLALCGEAVQQGKLFFVGDSKQSIYRFRGADPSVFRRMRQMLTDAGRLPLTLNFRSQPAILDFVNTLFAQAMGPDYEPLRAHRPQITPTPAVEFLWAPVEKEGETDAASAREQEAEWIARRIRGLIDSAEPLVGDQASGTARPPRPGDFAILFRALTDVEKYEAALRRWGLDYYVVGGHAFYAQQELFDLLNLLRSLVSRADAVSLAGVLRSPFFALADETLYWLAQHPAGLIAGLFADVFPDELAGEQRRRARFAADTLTALRAVKDRLPVAQLINEALALTGYDAVLVAEFLGERKLANLRKLIDQARSFDRAGIFTLNDFITQLAESVARQPKEAPAATQAENADVVRLMSIHQAKGLEFPVVVVPDLDRKHRPPTEPVVFHPRLGALVRMDGETPNPGLAMHQLVEAEEERAERNRLFYVAATRAADYLMLSSAVKELGATGGPWTELLATQFDLITGERLHSPEKDPSVRVTSQQPPAPGKPVGRARRADLPLLVAEVEDRAARGDVREAPLAAAVPADAASRRMFSFSRLSGGFDFARRSEAVHEPSDEEQPAPTAGGATVDPRVLGRLVHGVLEEIDFSRPERFPPLLERHAERLPKRPDAELKQAAEILEIFLQSPRAAQLARAVEMHRELDFLLRWPQAPAPLSEVCLEGVIDCLWRDAAGDLNIIDYKTHQAGGEAVAQRYEMQMLVYALAAERILGEPPKHLVLHFLRTGEEYEFPWHEAARRRAVQLVNQALADYVQRAEAPVG